MAIELKKEEYNKRKQVNRKTIVTIKLEEKKKVKIDNETEVFNTENDHFQVNMRILINAWKKFRPIKE